MSTKSRLIVRDLSGLDHAAAMVCECSSGEGDLELRRVIRVQSMAVLLVGLATAACTTNAAPTAWLGSERPADVKSGDFPELSAVPDRGAPTSSKQERREIVQSLIADRERARYTSDEIRGEEFTRPSSPSQPSADPAASANQPEEQSSLNIPRAEEAAVAFTSGKAAARVTEDIATENSGLTARADSTSVFATKVNFAEENLLVAQIESDAIRGSDFDVSGLRAEVFSRKLSESSILQAQLRPAASFAVSSAPKLPDRVIQMASSVSNLPAIDERIVDQGWDSPRSFALTSQWRLGGPSFIQSVRATPRLRVATVEGSADRSQDVVLARAVAGNTELIQSAFPQTSLAAVERGDTGTIAVNTRSNDLDGAASNIQGTALAETTIGAPNQGGAMLDADMAKLRELAMAQQDLGGTLHLVTHETVSDGGIGREDRSRQLRRARLIMLRMMELGVPASALRLETSVSGNSADAKTAPLGRVEIYLQPTAQL